MKKANSVEHFRALFEMTNQCCLDVCEVICTNLWELNYLFIYLNNFSHVYLLLTGLSLSL